MQSERAAAERVLAAQEAVRPLTAANIREMVEAVGDKVGILASADPETRAALYTSLGITLTYEHDRRIVHVEAQPGASCAYERVGGVTHTPSTRDP